MKGLTHYLLVLAIVVTAGLLALVRILPARADYLTSNPYWNGTEALMATGKVQAARGVTGIPASSALICIVYRPYTAAETAALATFAEGGGTLLVADDYRAGGALLAGLGLSTRLTAGKLLDSVICYEDRYLPKLIRILPDPLTAGVTALVLNHGAALENVPVGGALAMSSSFSFLDLNDNSLKDTGEPDGPFPALAVEGLGEGKILILSDPGLLINCNLPLGDNLKLIDNLAGLAPGGVFLDTSHLPPSNLAGSQANLAGLFGFLQQPAATAALAVLATVLAALLAYPANSKPERTTP